MEDLFFDGANTETGTYTCFKVLGRLGMKNLGCFFWKNICERKYMLNIRQRILVFKKLVFLACLLHLCDISFIMVCI